MANRRYLSIDKRYFFRVLKLHEEALKCGTREEIVLTSAAVHAALRNVPKSYMRHIKQVFRETVREQRAVI